ncbi:MULTISPECIES: DUF3892 domain-containing protein [Pseudomonas]|uniref:DUF3892 domain-containing protein n=1 Tax=Pseudomonas TaxID=286 RepID=UPI0006D469E6|nr:MULTISPECIES: DUF3892 domain-containing protein [Pseudomonas]PNB53820.1 DUF3892 domain-containing protein [Pseudomonas sp. FW305-130]MBP2081784.1 hypothetical protein [Pseudomonas sp. PvP089]MBP2086599.1 hypothetical protein [Pseudomonas sp. PvP088]MBP2221240.1 hypothetical protein [Pseudomonas putida]PNA86531.1 DUF3892 domain-containing protein [Pseudomonas sp. GW460-5]
MADVYFINGIKLDETEEHIEYVRVRKSVSKENFIVPRKFVAQLIQTGVSFKSRYHDGKDWHTGADVEVYESIYLRANPNRTAKDNLRNLPQI